MTTVNFCAEMVSTILRAFWLITCLIGMVLIGIGVVATEPEHTIWFTSFTYRQGFGWGFILVGISLTIGLANRLLVQPFTCQYKQ